MSELFSEKGFKRTTLFSWRRVWIVIFIMLAGLGVIFGSMLVQAKSYSNRVIPGLHIGGVAIGGMSTEEVKDFLHSMNDKLLNEGLHFSFQADDDEQEIFLYPVIVTEGTVIELMSIDIEKEVERIIKYGKSGSVIADAISFERSRFSKPSVRLENIVVDNEKIKFELEDDLSEYKEESKDATIDIKLINPLEYKIVGSNSGMEFQYEQAIQELALAWSMLEVPDVKINHKMTKPSVLKEHVESIVSRLPSVFDKGNITITYKDQSTRRSREWLITLDRIAEWINVQEVSDGEYGFGLDKDLVSDYFLSVIAPKVNVESRDAKFEIDELGKTKEFQSSRPGIQLDVDGTYNLLNDAVIQRTRHDEGVAKTVAIEVIRIEPNVTTGELNDLGISEILGIGISDFSGSPANRIKNIKNAVKKLNGLLIKPDEEFSAIKFTKPYTIDGGYLPELVIKGDEIKPEIGGGLCQIGTTLFRMAMNSAMPITQRRNHSLVVNYYNDLENGLPGTDATLYDPSPDFKFKNDTGQHVLIQAEIDEEGSQLLFTIWGTNDGRKGWYDPPVVEKWLPHGPTKFIETTNLAPGEKKCQHAFKGAETSFKYIRELANGEKIERVFESYYRPLPEICLIGVEEKIENCFTEDGQLKENCEEEIEENGDEPPLIVE